MSFEVDDQSYTAFLPADMDENDPDYGYIILKNLEENGEEIFGSVDDDAELGKHTTPLSLCFSTTKRRNKFPVPGNRTKNFVVLFTVWCYTTARGSFSRKDSAIDPCAVRGFF